jgi:vitamin B12 transporter
MTASAASAQDAGTTVLEGITIYSANRTPTDAAKVGSSVSVLTEADLEKQSRTYLKDYLEQLPGVSFAQNGPPGSSTRISIRGAEGKYIKVLVDGIDISDPSGVETVAQFENLLVGDISRIEVLRGSQSTLYGSDAVGGVISIETKGATKPGFSVRGGVEGGEHSTFRGAATAGYAATDGSNIAFTVQDVDTEGFSAAAVGTEDDGYDNLTFSGRGEYFLTPTAKIFFAARSLDATNHFDGFPPPTFTLGDTLDDTDTVQHAGRVGTEFSLLNGAFVNTFAIQGTKIERDNFSDGISTGFFDGDRVKGEYKGVLTFNDQLSLLAGADWEEIGAKSANTDGRNSADVAGAYAQLMVEPIDGLVLTGGGRIDDHSTFGEFNTYRLTAAYLVPGTETKFRATRATGFRAPSLDELFGSYSFAPDYGNPNLQPEESESWDAGIDQGFSNGRLTLSATYFELDTDNLIVYNFACGIPGALCLENVPGVTQRNGVELTAAALITDGIAVTAGYTYVDTETPDDERLTHVPRHNFVVGVDIEPIDKVELNVTVKYVADTLQAVDVPLDDYVLVSAKASYEFTPGWKAYVRGENLLDEEYQTVLGYGTPGLSVYGGLTLALPSD